VCLEHSHFFLMLDGPLGFLLSHLFINTLREWVRRCCGVVAVLLRCRNSVVRVVVADLLRLLQCCSDVITVLVVGLRCCCELLRCCYGVVAIVTVLFRCGLRTCCGVVAVLLLKCALCPHQRVCTTDICVASECGCWKRGVLQRARHTEVCWFSLASRASVFFRSCSSILIYARCVVWLCGCVCVCVRVCVWVLWVWLCGRCVCVSTTRRPPLQSTQNILSTPFPFLVLQRDSP